MMSNIDSPSWEQQPDDHGQATKDEMEPGAGMALAPAVVITCSLCGAGFSPAKEYEYLLRAEAKKLEAAFMSVCHVCFRCRRAACPECWDPVHRLCGQCVAEVGLPFRAEPAPLPGALAPVTLAAETPEPETRSPLVCVRHGRWAVPSEPETGHDQQAVTVSERPQIEMNRLAEIQTAPHLIALVVTDQAGAGEGQVVDGSKAPAGKRMFAVIERVLTIILLALLFVIVALVVLAEVSSFANAAIARLLHVDIRAEAAYILNLAKHIRW